VTCLFLVGLGVKATGARLIVSSRSRLCGEGLKSIAAFGGRPSGCYSDSDVRTTRIFHSVRSRITISSFLNLMLPTV
jgi:hypothetical protein